MKERHFGKMDIEALGAMTSTGLGTSEAMGTTRYQMLVEREKGRNSPLPLSQDELIVMLLTAPQISARYGMIQKNKDRIIAAL